jgi:hypothetical protein
MVYYNSMEPLIAWNNNVELLMLRAENISAIEMRRADRGSSIWPI